MSVGYSSHYTPTSAMFVDSCLENGIPCAGDLNTHKGTLGTTRVCAFSF
jgi:hypothetical protein